MKKAINMRLEENIIKIIKSESGETFTDKFVNLVVRLDKEKSNKESHLKQLQKNISDKETRLEEIQKCISDISVILRRY